MFSVIIILVFLASLSLAEIPKLINYQGMLTDDSGDPIDGNPNIIFRIYDDTTGGTQKWTETHSGVPVTNGLFNVILGSNVPIDTLSFSQQYWLEVQVDDDTMPRIQFTSVGYAYRAQWADTADYALGGGGGSGSPWIFRITDGADTTVTTGGGWGIARYGNTLYGNADSTHVNLGVACTTGTSGQNYKYCSVGGGVGNIASGGCATVGGGSHNTADTTYATVAGGFYNTASGDRATVGGGFENTADAAYGTVAGGRTNTASATYATVAGGFHNTASGQCASVGGGTYNAADTNDATVAGGSHNTASGDRATVGGGYDNTADTSYATVGGGRTNTASGYCATMGGGYSNAADTTYATVGGGYNNTANGYSAIVGGGSHNTASESYATVGGGNYNTASGAYSFAAGRRAKANHEGAFVWADGTNADFASTGSNQFLIRASGGVGIGTTQPTQTLDVDGTVRLRDLAGSGIEPAYLDEDGVLVRGSFSSRRYKENIRGLDVDPENVLGLETVRFQWKTSDKQDVGLIAEDVQELIPDLVRYDKEGRPDGVKYEKLSLYLLEAMKSLKAENEILKLRIEALETK